MSILIDDIIEHSIVLAGGWDKRDIFGAFGRNLLDSIMNGEILTLEKVEKLVYTSLKKKVPDLIEAFQGFVRKHHRILLPIHLDKIDFLNL